MALTLSREIAYDTFVKVMEAGQRPEDLLEEAYSSPRGKHVKRLDRNFIKELLYGSLRWYSKLYWILQKTSDRNLDTSSPEIRAALVLGTYQIYYMESVPDRAAVNESVEYIRSRNQSHACPFVNGILRQIARRAEYFVKPDKEKEAAAYLALQYAHPTWMVDRWVKHFKFEKLANLLASNNEIPPMTVRVNPFKTSCEDTRELQAMLLRDESTHSDRQSLRGALTLKDSPSLGEGSLFSKGFFTIQDLSSQLVGHLLDPKPGEKILDTCAGPGGKLSHIYELTGGDVELVGIERSKRQLDRIRDNLARLEISEKISLVQADFLDWQVESSGFQPNKILLDAPCSGLGVLRRHPEGKWQKDRTIVTAMVLKQRQLLKHALAILPSGGELVYSICSFEQEEAGDQMNWLVNEYGQQIEILTPVARLPDYFKRYVTRENLLTIHSGNTDQMDGFSAFCIRKN